MKNLFLKLVTIILVGCGTDQGQGNFYNYTLKNESGKEITINTYRTNYPVRMTPIKIQLSNGESLTKTYQDVLPPSGYGFTVFFEGDSMIVNYNNEKKQIFTITPNHIRNPFSYTDLIETFVFTEQDFENAQPCNGNCN